MSLISLILTLAIISGQLIKIPLLSNSGGVTILDLTVILLCLIGLLKLKLKLLTPPLFLISAFAFIFIAVLSLILTPLHLQFVEYLTSFFYILRFSSYILLGWIIYSGAFPSLKRDLLKILTFSGFTLAILGLAQLIFLPDLRFLQNQGWDPHYFRTVSTFLDPNFLGGYFVLTLILLIKKRTKINVLMFIPIYLALLTTFSRGTYLAFFISFLTLSFLNRSKKLAVLTIILSAILLFGYYNYQKSVAEPRGIDRTQSASFRLNTWQQGAALFQQRPILGIGFNSYKYGLREYNLASEDFLKSHGASTNDSSLLFVSSTTGIIGLIAYLFFLTSLVKTGWKKYLQKNTWGAVVISAIAGITIQSFFANTLFYPFILIWIILVSTKLWE